MECRANGSGESCYRGRRLNVGKPCKLALTMEVATTEAKLLPGEHKEAQVNRVEPPRTKPGDQKEPTNRWDKAKFQNKYLPREVACSTITCNRCGSSYHKATECPVKDKECFRCSHKGHTRRMCRWRGRVNNVKNEEHEISDEEEREEVFGILQLPGKQRRARKTLSLTVDVSVQGTRIRMEVDTGASSSHQRGVEQAIQQTKT